MTNSVFAVSGNKIASLVVGENSLMFSSKTFNSVEEFKEGWDKKLSLATKVEVKFESIKSVKKEDGDTDISVRYKTFAGLPSDCVFSFSDSEAYETFFTYLERERFFNKSQEQLSPFKAITNYLIGLAATIGFTAFSYFQAQEIAAGTVEEASNRKARLFNNIIGALGDKGVLLVGGAITCFLAYKIWTRFSNPPGQLNFCLRTDRSFATSLR
jgi:hypothetical protein